MGSPHTAFLVGILLTLPGASYLVGMARISEANASTAATTIGVMVFCVIMLLLIEIPLIGFTIAPDATRRGVKRFTDWVSANTRTLIARTALVLGSLLLIRAAIELVA